MNKRGRVGKIILISLTIVVLVAAIYFTFFFSYKCEDIACFQAHQEKCSRTKFINNKEDVSWEYNIKGKKDGMCRVGVKILQAKTGSLVNLNLEGKSMDCYPELGSTNSPEGDISKCHGVLKEELQEIIIQKLHSYIVESMGDIGKELGKVI